jgi:hypothetical protein
MYINLSHRFYDKCPCCTHLVTHTAVWLKIIQYQIYNYKRDRNSCKQQPFAYQLHSDWL